LLISKPISAARATNTDSAHSPRFLLSLIIFGFRFVMTLGGAVLGGEALQALRLEGFIVGWRL
jgi:hypothetical protein